MDTQTTTTETGAPVAVDAPTLAENSKQATLKDTAAPPAAPDAQPSAYQAITDVKNQGDALIAHVKKHGASHELSQAIAKIEEGIMWAIKHLGKAL